MTPHDKRDLYRAEDDAWSRAFELALTPLVAGGIGYLLDRLVGLVPLFTIIFLAMAVVATFVKMYYAYDAKMKAHDAESPWGRARAYADRGRGRP
ncbi:MAG: AtpZ/AtpI family protein [Actinomycetota bacterium]|nr:AtpZ/AtpI family protein [Actinomycetota bacterium]